MAKGLDIETVDLTIPEGCSIILGQSHFIKTVEDLYEIIITSNPKAEFGIAFSEASGPRLIRRDGTDQELTDIAIKNIMAISAGHCFLIMLKNVFPISVLNQVKQCQEVVNIFAATSNPVKVLVARDNEHAAILGVMDGFSPLGVETVDNARERMKFLRNIGYKR
ncbi:MAG: adenosine-specific kinase [Thermoplasmataceae archaeon]|jgi:adenosine/AMP kinase